MSGQCLGLQRSPRTRGGPVRCFGDSHYFFRLRELSSALPGFFMEQRRRSIDIVLWTAIVLYTGVIYATLPLVARWRKTLVESYGPGVFDNIYWVFVALALGFLVYLFLRLRGTRLVRALVVLGVVGTMYAYYLTGMRYSVERIHFLEYGLLGALLLVAMRRYVDNFVASLCALCIGYLAGLGDEAIQWGLPSRVGEIRDSVINFISAALGIALVWFVFVAFRSHGPIRCRHLRTLILLVGVSTLATVLFLWNVHGFGHVYESCEAGRIYTSFSSAGLRKINEGEATSRCDMAVYRNEARRHLFQREFYRTNDFLARDGSYYRQYWKSFYENRILERYYSRYVQEHAAEASGEILMSMDAEVGRAAGDMPVQWPDSVENWVAGWVGSPRFYTSRVKQTIITGFRPRDMVFYAVLIAGLLAYAWIRTGQNREEEERTRAGSMG